MHGCHRAHRNRSCRPWQSRRTFPIVRADPAPIVTFKLPANSKREDIFDAFDKTARIWRDNPDLIRKNYLYDAEAGIAGGVYLWKEKAHALKWHGEEFRQRVKDLYGATPTSQIFETPIVVDNVAGAISTDYDDSVAA